MIVGIGWEVLPPGEVNQGVYIVVKVTSYHRQHILDVQRECQGVFSFCSLASLSTFDEIEDMWQFFKSSLFCVLDEHAPLRLVVSKFSKRPTPWMISELL